MVSFFLSGFSRMNYRETVSPGSGIMQVVWLVSGYHNPKMIGIVLFQAVDSNDEFWITIIVIIMIRDFGLIFVQQKGFRFNISLVQGSVRKLFNMDIFWKVS